MDRCITQTVFANLLALWIAQLQAAARDFRCALPLCDRSLKQNASATGPMRCVGLIDMRRHWLSGTVLIINLDKCSQTQNDTHSNLANAIDFAARAYSISKKNDCICQNPTKLNWSAVILFKSVFTARCTIVQSAVLRSHVVCTSVCLFVCPSVTLMVDQDHIGWKSWKLTVRTIRDNSPNTFALRSQKATHLLPGEMGNVGNFENRVSVGKSGVLEHKNGNISETRKDRG